MMAFFKMNSADLLLQHAGVNPAHGYFPISEMIFAPIIDWFNFGTPFLHFTERAAWWFHFVGILFFMNYLYYSKHLHIIFAFPNTWFAKLQPKGELNNLESVTKEIKLMMEPDTDPYAAPADAAPNAVPEKFGANDIYDL